MTLTDIEIESIHKARKLTSLQSTTQLKIKSQFHWINSYAELKYCITNNIILPPQCLLCNKTHTCFDKGNWCYQKYCSKECRDSGKISNTKKTMISKYGVDHNFKLQSQKDKRSETWFLKYGVDNPSKSPEIIKKIKETKLINHGDENFNNYTKTKETICVMYGNEIYFKTKDFKYKSRNTKEIKYCDAYYNNRELAKLTCVEKYGVEHTSQDEYIHMLQQKYRYYNIISPSGKEIKVQGYERFIIPNLWERYGENEIILSRSEIPKIWYEDYSSNQHRYFPDGYIPESNTILEIKSEWTLLLAKNKLIQIIKSLEKSNFNLMLLVYNPKDKTINEYDLHSTKIKLSEL